MASTPKKKDDPKPKTNPNLELWNKVCITDPNFAKRVDQRGGFTSINATWQAWQATELWGPYGKAWGVKNLVFSWVGPSEHPAGIILSATFFCPESEFELATDMPYKPNHDCCKKLVTDLTTKALSKLGFSADIFFGLWDDARYASNVGQTYAQHRAATTGNAPPAEAPATPPPAAQPPSDERPESSGEFVGPFTLAGLEGAVATRLMTQQHALLKSFLPPGISKNDARWQTVELTKTLMRDRDGLQDAEGQVSGENAEAFYLSVLTHIADKIAERQAEPPPSDEF